ncbi:MAG TPA: hypothetical protein GXX55_09185 [Firmicutes bacterium]|nr:hypothetical protein [Bacillota bacterium]
MEGIRYSALGISLVLTALIYLGAGIWGGLYLDRRYGTEPAFLLLGLGFGLAASLGSLYLQGRAVWRRGRSRR